MVLTSKKKIKKAIVKGWENDKSTIHARLLQTTLKHLKLFLGTTAPKKDIEKLIKTGVYVIVSEQ